MWPNFMLYSTRPTQARASTVFHIINRPGRRGSNLPKAKPAPPGPDIPERNDGTLAILRQRPPGHVRRRHERPETCESAGRRVATYPGPGAHIPVDRYAPLAEFEPVTARYPVFRVDAVTTPTRTAQGR